MTQTKFQRRIWEVAQAAHAAADRADARILLEMNGLIDLGDYPAMQTLVRALQAHYRDLLGRIPRDRDEDGPGAERSLGLFS